MKKIRIWDLPTRLFHWALALLIAASIITQNIGGNAMEWHFLAGYGALTLVLFRLLWSLAGSRYARLSQLFHAPSAIFAYLRNVGTGPKNRYLGHNPLGSLSVLALLAAVLAQALSGMFANDDIASEGPLVKFISKDLSDRITWFHTEVSALLIYVLVGLHVAAIAYYYFPEKGKPGQTHADRRQAGGIRSAGGQRWLGHAPVGGGDPAGLRGRSILSGEPESLIQDSSCQGNLRTKPDKAGGLQHGQAFNRPFPK